MSDSVGRLRRWAKSIKAESHALYLAARDPRTPWYAKLLVMAVAAYALSPIDLIPDFIPVLGYLDDLVIVPGGIYLAVKIIPADVMRDCRARAAEAQGRPFSRAAAVFIVALWIGSIALCAYCAWRLAFSSA